MVAILEKVKNYLTGSAEAYEDERDDFEEQEEKEEPRFKLHKFRQEVKKEEEEEGAGARIVTYAPKDIEDAMNVLKYFKKNKAVVFTVVDISLENKRRVVDYLSGAVQVLGGDVYKITNGVFVAEPVLGNTYDKIKLFEKKDNKETE